jgi:phenylalanyl-tRNA synthetase beta subunit
VLVKGETIGSIGAVHPEVLNKLEWNHPVVAWEIDVEKL